MKIVAPISRPSEVAPVARAGADELYCGIVPPDWTERFHNAGVNRRAFGNLAAYEDLREVVGRAADLGCTVSLVMNAQHYGEGQIDALVDLAFRFADMGGQALIVGDLGLLCTLAERGPALRLNGSSLLGCRNTAHALLHEEIGTRRIVFPRDMTIAEMAEITAACSHLEFEAFILNDGCVFEEGSCHTIHLPARMGGPICLDRYQSKYTRCDGRPLSSAEADSLAANDKSYDSWLWYRFSCGFAVTQEGLPFGPCGLCSIPQLAAAGITAVKIAGREGAVERKVTSGERVRAALTQYRATGSAASLGRFARNLRGQPALCDSAYMCYYRPTGAYQELVEPPRSA